MQEIDHSETMTTFEAAKYLEVSVATVQRYLDKGKLEGTYNILTGDRKILRRSAEQLLSSAFRRHMNRFNKKGGDTCPAGFKVGGTD